jgi:hypothetical protein
MGLGRSKRYIQSVTASASRNRHSSLHGAESVDHGATLI